MEIFFTSKFIREFKNLDSDLQEEVAEKIEQFKNLKNHSSLKVHKLKGPLSGRYGFSVNYKTRVVFSWKSKNEAILLTIGDHDVYK